MVTKDAEYLPEIFDAMTKGYWMEVEYKRHENDEFKTHDWHDCF